MMKYIFLLSLIVLSISIEITDKDPSYENAIEIYKFFKAKGWTVNAICGMLGNMQYDSNGIQPNTEEMGEGEYGLTLWLPGTILSEWAKEKGLDYSTVNTQCQRIQWELENNERYAKNKCSYSNFEAYSKSEDSAEKLAACFITEYVYGGDSTYRLEDKKKSASYFYYRFTSNQPLIYSYQIALENWTKSDLVVNDNKSYAGIIGEPIADLAISTNIGKLTYQVFPIGRADYLPVVSQFNWDDYINGYAGNHKQIDRVKIYFEGIEQPYYRVASVRGEYSEWQYGRVIDESRGFKGFAGEKNVPVDRIQIVACKPKNFTIFRNLREINDEEFPCIYYDNPKKETDNTFSSKLQFNFLLLFLLIINFI